MKFKSFLFFLFGFVAWLFLTDYENIYSKVASRINTNEELVVTKSSNDVTELVERQTKLDSKNIETSDEEINATEQNTETIEVVESNEEDTGNQVASYETASENTVNLDTPSVSTDDNSSYTTSSQEEQVNPISTSMHHPMMNSYAMNSTMYMNPMAMMMLMMGQMMNPAIYNNPMYMMNYPIDFMTQTQNMESMMKSMDPSQIFGMFGQPNEAYQQGEVPEQLPVITVPGLPTQSLQSWSKNTVSPNLSREAKHHAFQTAMAMSPLSMRNMVSMMADKMPVEEGVSWDDAVEAMKLRANEVNFKFVGSSPLWKQIEAETEQPSAKVEMFRFCDARMARKILDEVPEFIIFLPCKIALLEDAEGKLWVMTLDWDVSWMDYAQNPNNHLSKDIREHAKKIRENIHYIMEGAATGDF